MFKSEKGFSKVILILIVILVAIIAGSVMFFMSKNKNLPSNKANNTSNNISENWGLTINGTSISLPCSLDELTKVGVNINESRYEELVSSTNKTFSGSRAGSDGWKEGISLDLKTGSDVSKKEKNVTVSSISYDIPSYYFSSGKPATSNLLTSSQFSIKNNITIGSKSEDVISTFGTDYEPKTETNLNGAFSVIYYESGNSRLTIGFAKGIVNKIVITIY